MWSDCSQYWKQMCSAPDEHLPHFSFQGKDAGLVSSCSKFTVNMGIRIARVLYTHFAVGFYVTFLASCIRYLACRLLRRVIGPEQTVCLCLKVYTARCVALHSHGFYITPACECPLLMVVLHSQKLDFFAVILRMRVRYEAQPNSTRKLTKFNWEAHQIQLLQCSPVVSRSTLVLLT